MTEPTKMLKVIEKELEMLIDALDILQPDGDEAEELRGELITKLTKLLHQEPSNAQYSDIVSDGGMDPRDRQFQGGSWGCPCGYMMPGTATYCRKCGRPKP